MKGTRRSAVAALAVFALIAATILGGLTWATVAQFRVAELEALESHENKVREALWRMDGELKSALGSEFARNPKDYQYNQSVEPESAWAEDGKRVDVDKVLIRSPIAEGNPSFDWIDLYFQVDEEGDWSSPQLENGFALSFRLRSTWHWLRDTLTVGRLSERVDAARTIDDRPAISEREERSVDKRQTLASRRGDLPRGSGRQSDFIRRGVSKLDAQKQQHPPSQCVEPDHQHSISDTQDDLSVCTQLVSVDIEAKPWAVFWLEPKPGEGEKLAFVRTGHQDGRLFFQGFVGDWSKLKPKLLGKIEDLFPETDLEPVATSDDVGPSDDHAMLNVIPARLVGPGVMFTGAAEARRPVLGIVATTWAVGIAVLVIAGVAVRNLVALTNRRLQFAYAVTHELRTPLTTFRLYSDMLSAGLVPEEKKQEYLDSLNRESLRLSNLVQGVLEYARLENQKIRLNPVDTSAPALLETISATLEERCGGHGVRTEAANDFPNGQTLHVDVNLVNQIAGVLVDNAVRHARSSSEPAVSVRLAGTNGHLSIDVVDSGPGIDLADSRAIFRPFRRGQSAEATAQRGIGLGLALARTWASLLGGNLDLVARHDPTLGGAHFRLTFPTHQSK